MLTFNNRIIKHNPTKTSAYIIYGIGILPFYVSFNRNILNKRFLFIYKFYLLINVNYGNTEYK